MVCNINELKMAEDDSTIVNIIRDIESGEFDSKTIIEKYGLTSYKYYRILKEGNLKNSCRKKMESGIPKNTAFTRLLKLSITPDMSSFDLDSFKEDCEKGIKLSELMEKYKLSLYQVRELRKKYGFTKTQ
jgi:Mor family transcriptional regulator